MTAIFYAFTQVHR